MEGSADDLGAPDSWEVSDLDASVIRLKLSSKKNQTAPSQSLEEPTPSVASSSSSTSSSLANGASLEDVSKHVDPFLIEALQNPRERLSSKGFEPPSLDSVIARAWVRVKAVL